MNNRFSFPEKWVLEQSAYFHSPGMVGIYDNKPRWGANLAVRKTLLKDKLNISAGVNDIFYSNVVRTKVIFQNQNTDLYSTFDLRRFTLAVNYNFGKIKVQQRKTKSNEEEKARLTH